MTDMHYPPTGDLIGELDSLGGRGVPLLDVLPYPLFSFMVDRDGKRQKIGPYTGLDIERFSECLVTIAQENGSIKSTIEMPDWTIRGRVGAYEFLIKNGLFGVSLTLTLACTSNNEPPPSGDGCGVSNEETDVEFEELLTE